MALESRAWIISRVPMADTRGFLRDNAVLVAAFVLPAIVAVLFILATAIPKWTVPLPQHDLLVRVEQYESPPPDMSVEYLVRDGRLEAVKEIETQVDMMGRHVKAVLAHSRIAGAVAIGQKPIPIAPVVVRVVGVPVMNSMKISQTSRQFGMIHEK